MQSLARETEKMMSTVEGNEFARRHAARLGAKAAQYEIATFGTAAALVGQLGLGDDQKVPL